MGKSSWCKNRRLATVQVMVASSHRPLEQLFRDTLARLDPCARVEQALAELPLTAASAVVVALGKAALPMFEGARRNLAARGLPIVASVVVTPAAGGGGRSARAPISAPHTLIHSSHPVPDERSMYAARELLRAVREAPPSAEILALISGGGSALAALPAPGLTLADKVATTDALAASGAPIDELNVVRKHLSAIKGGRLATNAARPVTTLVASDVVGDDLATVASGPTIADPSSYADAIAILDRRLPTWQNVGRDGGQGDRQAVRAYLEQGRLGHIDDTPARARPGDRALLVAGTDALIDAAADAASERKWHARVVARGVTGEVASVAEQLLAHAERLSAAWSADEVSGGRPPGRTRAPVCLLAGGEPTVTLPRQRGRGGRAHHLALYLARALHNRPHLGDIEILIAGSDGVDGNSEAAGAIVDARTWSQLQALGIDGERALRQCDAGSALAAVGASVVTGPTGVNHADLMVVAAGIPGDNCN